MLATISIKSLYALALAEGEGVGTAYEYFAKRLVLSRWLPSIPRPQHILIAGLPEKYGSSLDFLQLAAELGASVTVVDERAAALEKLRMALAAAQAQGLLIDLRLHCLTVADLATLAEVQQPFDLCLSSEVAQRLAAEARVAYAGRLLDLATAVALFAPNADNPAHTNLSGLNGLRLEEMASLLDGQSTVRHAGYIDMPPFPPGIIRTEAQRSQASHGRLEAVAMWVLGYYARMEKFLPLNVRRRQSHIVYALS